MATASAPIVRFCATCRGDVSFEQPDCLDAHDEDCPEWVCVQCGDAVLVGLGPFGADLLPMVAASVA